MNGKQLPREALLAALNANAKSISQIAAELGIPVRSAAIYRSMADVRPVFRTEDGEALFAHSDVEKIRQAKEKHGPLRFRGEVKGEIVTVGTDL